MQKSEMYYSVDITEILKIFDSNLSEMLSMTAIPIYGKTFCLVSHHICLS